MQMNLDFCFLDDRRIVAVTGWTTQPQPVLRLHVGDDVLEPVTVTRHVRRDLRSSEPLGVIALFDLADLANAPGATGVTMHLADADAFTELRAERLAEDARRLVGIGVDEVFFALLRLLASRRLQLSDAETGREICARLRPAASAPRETEGHVLAVDRCLMTATGEGAVLGWFMAATATTEPLCALVIGAETIAPVDLLAGSMARADLAGYAPRYRFTGRDGYCGGWRLPQVPAGPVRLLMMPPGDGFHAGVLVPVEPAAAHDLAQLASSAAQGLDDLAERARLRRALLPGTLPRPVLTDGTAAAGTDTLLILDHDLADADLRDVLRGIGPHLSGRLRLHLLRPRLNATLRNAVEGAAREVAGGFALEAVGLAIGQPQDLPGRVVFARSALLAQLDPAALLDSGPARPRVTLIDPIGSILAATTADRLARDLLPFALSMPGPAFFDLLAQIPDCFLTAEARLRLLVEALVAADAAGLHRADPCRYFEGRSGPHCQSFADGRDWHGYDAESRRLIEEARAA